MSNNHVKGQLHNDFVKKMLLCALILVNVVSLALLAVNTVKFPIIPTKYVMVLYLVLIILLFVGVLLLKSKKIFLNLPYAGKFFVVFVVIYSLRHPANIVILPKKI